MDYKKYGNLGIGQFCKIVGSYQTGKCIILEKTLRSPIKRDLEYFIVIVLFWF